MTTPDPRSTSVPDLPRLRPHRDVGLVQPQELVVGARHVVLLGVSGGQIDHDESVELRDGEAGAAGVEACRPDDRAGVHPVVTVCHRGQPGHVEPAPVAVVAQHVRRRLVLRVAHHQCRVGNRIRGQGGRIGRWRQGRRRTEVLPVRLDDRDGQVGLGVRRRRRRVGGAGQGRRRVLTRWRGERADPHQHERDSGADASGDHRSATSYPGRRLVPGVLGHSRLRDVDGVDELTQVHRSSTRSAPSSRR